MSIYEFLKNQSLSNIENVAKLNEQEVFKSDYFIRLLQYRKQYSHDYLMARDEASKEICIKAFDFVSESIKRTLAL